MIRFFKFIVRKVALLFVSGSQRNFRKLKDFIAD
jgi:hypothetical protein